VMTLRSCCSTSFAQLPDGIPQSGGLNGGSTSSAKPRATKSRWT
jgi:hypothetical protein